jgi:DNA primase
LISSFASDLGIELMRTNTGWKGRCPVHGDKKASLNIYEETNSFCCFGCGIGGSVIDFYRHYIEPASVGDTIKKLKERVK